MAGRRGAPARSTAAGLSPNFTAVLNMSDEEKMGPEREEKAGEMKDWKKKKRKRKKKERKKKGKETPNSRMKERS